MSLIAFEYRSRRIDKSRHSRGAVFEAFSSWIALKVNSPIAATSPIENPKLMFSITSTMIPFLSTGMDSGGSEMLRS